MVEPKKRLVVFGKYLAEVEMTPERDPHVYPFETVFAPEELRKLERVRLALMFGNIAGAAEEARVFEMRRV